MESNKPVIAICAATRSKSNWRLLKDTTLQTLLVPSIEKTVSSYDRSEYDFRLYLAADADDQFWLLNQNSLKTPSWLPVHIGFYETPEHKIPFNPLMRTAYNDGAEYFVRINDDTEFVTSDWVSKAVAKLSSYDPPNVGMVGPNCREGNTAIMTHDMVHRTHLDIFEHYYPDVFSAWWIDDWISKVYGPRRSTKMMDWMVKHHTHKHGTRYEVQHHEEQLLKGELEKGRKRIEAWLLSSAEPVDLHTKSDKPKQHIREIPTRVQNIKRKTLSNEEGNAWISNKFEEGVPFLIGRLGAAEACLTEQYLSGKEYLRACHNPHSSSGIYPENSETFKQFATIYMDSLRQLESSDAMATFPNIKTYEDIIFKVLKMNTIMKNRALEPFYFEDPWSKHLRDKTVLIVHGFVPSIKCQLRRAQVLFSNPEILPPFKTKFVHMPQALGGRTPHKSYMETLSYVKTQIDDVGPFDVAIIAAGAYSMPLALYCKVKHSATAIAMGGGSQLLFGLKGKRWNTHPILSKLYNKNWIYPLEEDTPQNAKHIELGGPYWGPANERHIACPVKEVSTLVSEEDLDVRQCIDVGFSNVDHYCCDEDGKKANWQNVRRSIKQYPVSARKRLYMDVGVNTGEDLRFFTARGPHDVIAFEPIPRLYNAIKARTSDGGTGRYEWFNFGLGDSNTSMVICDEGQSTRGEGSSVFQVNKKGKNCFDIDIRPAGPTLANILNGRQVDLIVINCEGCEYALLESVLSTKNLVIQFDKILLSRHSINKDKGFQKKNRFVERYCNIEALLKKTHTRDFVFPWIWESWSLKKETPYTSEIKTTCTFKNNIMSWASDPRLDPMSFNACSKNTGCVEVHTSGNGHFSAQFPSSATSVSVKQMWKHVEWGKTTERIWHPTVDTQWVGCNVEENWVNKQICSIDNPDITITSIKEPNRSKEAWYAFEKIYFVGDSTMKRCFDAGVRLLCNNWKAFPEYGKLHGNTQTTCNGQQLVYIFSAGRPGEPNRPTRDTSKALKTINPTEKTLVIFNSGHNYINLPENKFQELTVKMYNIVKDWPHYIALTSPAFESANWDPESRCMRNNIRISHSNKIWKASFPQKRVFDIFWSTLQNRNAIDGVHYKSGVYDNIMHEMTSFLKITVKHHIHKHGTRYEVQHHEEQMLKGELERGQKRIETWLHDQKTQTKILKVHILTMNRAKSLQRLLNSLEKAEYVSDRVNLNIHIDKSADNHACIKVAESFQFSNGEVTIDISDQNNGLRNAWFRAWRPLDNERAIILEDDVELSTQWYKWLKRAWEANGERDDLAGISLQRQTLVPQKPHKQIEIVNNHKPFLYRLVGSIGFSPHWKHWRAFLNWIDSVDTSTVDVKTPGLITSDWMDTLDRRHMWTQYFIWFCKQHDLYTLYINLPKEKTLAAHMREKGEHYGRTEGRDFALATEVDMNFPLALVKYGWDGRMVVRTKTPPRTRPVLVTDGSEYGGWTYDSSQLTSDSVVYSVGLGEDTSWDEGIMKRFGLNVWGFDPTTKSIEYVHKNNKLGQNFHFTAEALGIEKGVRIFTKPKNPNHVSMREGRHDGLGETVEVHTNTLQNWMDKFSHSHIDILKIDIEGSEYDVLEDWIKKEWFPMDQLLIEFHQRFFENKDRHFKVLAGLKESGFEIIHDKKNKGQEIAFHKLQKRASDFVQQAKMIQSLHGFVNIQLLNTGYVDMTKSWICNVRSFPGVLEKTLFITTDQIAHDKLLQFDSSLNVVLELYETPKDLTYGQYAYYDFMLFRTRLLIRLLKEKITVWLTESDAVWLNDPTDIVLNTHGDMVTMSDGKPPAKILQGGFQLLRPTNPTVSVWTKLLAMFQRKMSATKKGTNMNDSGSEQLMLNGLIRKEPNLNMQWLDWYYFAPGLYYKSKEKWVRPYVILNNWIKGNKAKISRAKKWKHWFLDENGECLIKKILNQ